MPTFAAQIKARKQVAGTLRHDLAHYRELAAFAQFGSDLDKGTLQKLNRGARLVELLKQPQYRPMGAHEQVISIYAATKGFMDDVDVSAVRKFESELLEFLKTSKAALVEEIKTKKALDKEIEAKLQGAINEFKKDFKA